MVVLAVDVVPVVVPVDAVVWVAPVVVVPVPVVPTVCPPSVALPVVVLVLEPCVVPEPVVDEALLPEVMWTVVPPVELVAVTRPVPDVDFDAVVGAHALSASNKARRQGLNFSNSRVVMWSVDVGWPAREA